MANDVRRWLPLALIAVAAAAAALAVRDLPPAVTIDLRGLLPVRLESSADTAPRWLAVMLLPGLAALIWALFQLLRRGSGLNLARAIIGDLPDELAEPGTIERIRATYDGIVLWVVVLILGVHAGLIAAALGYETLAPRLTAVILGISLVALGNVLPRLRPNLIAGIRTRQMLRDPQLWRATHRILGGAFVIVGVLTIVVGLVAPAYALITALAGLVLACVIAAARGRRAASA